MNDANHTEMTATDPRVTTDPVTATDPPVTATDPRGAVTDPRVAVSRATGGGRGRHRGPVCAQDDEAPPRGRHRKPAEQTDAAA